MKPYQFNLDRILKLKERELETLTAKWMALKLQLDGLKSKLDEVIYQKQQVQQDKSESMRQSISGYQLQQFQYLEVSLNMQEEQLKQQLTELHRHVQMALSLRNEKKKEVNGLEKLKEKKYEEYKKISEKEEEKELEQHMMVKSYVSK